MATVSASATTFPQRVLPMLATSCEPFDDPEFLFETKWDGVRAMASVKSGSVRLWGKEGIDYTDRYPEICVALQELPRDSVVDGELVMPHGRSADFHALMARHRRRPGKLPFLVKPARYVVFDVLCVGGQSLLRRPLQERREQLQEILPQHPYLSLCTGVIGRGRRFFASAVAAGHEGVVAKRLQSFYTPHRRTGAWRKIKARMTLPCVVIGYRTGGSGLRELLMASLLDGRLRYVGAVELGIDRSPETLQRLEARSCRTSAVPCGLPARWICPELFCTVHFCGWRPGRTWRDAVFGGWVND